MPPRLRPVWLTCLLWLAGSPVHADAPPPNHLSLAAGCLEKGDDAAACAHLRLYLQAHPEHRNARFYHGELLMKLGRHVEARGEFEQAIRWEQEEPRPDLKHLVHCHSRLLDAGEALH